MIAPMNIQPDNWAFIEATLKGHRFISGGLWPCMFRRSTQMPFPAPGPQRRFPHLGTLASAKVFACFPGVSVSHLADHSIYQTEIVFSSDFDLNRSKFRA